MESTDTLASEVKEKLQSLLSRYPNPKSNRWLFKEIKEDHEFYKSILLLTNFLAYDVLLQERIYCILHSLNQRVKCKNSECVKLCNFQNLVMGYTEYCSNICFNKSTKSTLMGINQDNLNVKIIRINKLRKWKTKRKQYKRIEVKVLTKENIKIQLLEFLNRYGKKNILLLKKNKQLFYNIMFYSSHLPCGRKLEISERIFHIIHDLKNTPVCPSCGSELTYFGLTAGYAKYCSSVCSNAAPDVKKLKAKRCIEKYGFENPFQNAKIKEKIKKTLYTRYGVCHISQCSSTIDKNMFRRKQYIFPSGKYVFVQGYEIYTLDMLLKYHAEDDIIIGAKNIERFSGKLFYIGANKKKHRYFPDIYVKSENKIYEVKSTYTLKADWVQNELKRFAALDAGLNFEYFVVRQFDIRECKASRAIS